MGFFFFELLALVQLINFPPFKKRSSLQMILGILVRIVGAFLSSLLVKYLAWFLLILFRAKGMKPRQMDPEIYAIYAKSRLGLSFASNAGRGCAGIVRGSTKGQR